MRHQAAYTEAERHIRERLPLAPVPGLDGVRLHRPTPQSGLAHLAGLVNADQSRTMPPYWAYAWAGGLALAHHLRLYPDIVKGQRVLDLGAGSGLVGIVATQLGAGAVLASDIDVLARIVIPLNAAANDVSITVSDRDFLRHSLAPQVHGCDVILVGDLFYDQALAKRVLPALTAAAKAGCTVLIGDPARKTLPLDQLDQVAIYKVTDMGLPASAPLIDGLVLSPQLS